MAIVHAGRGEEKRLGQLEPLNERSEMMAILSVIPTDGLRNEPRFGN
jgi:hypothetical protein